MRGECSIRKKRRRKRNHKGDGIRTRITCNKGDMIKRDKNKKKEKCRTPKKLNPKKKEKKKKDEKKHSQVKKNIKKTLS